MHIVKDSNHCPLFSHWKNF